MKIKSNEGITLITLAITIIILVILAFATISIGINLTGTVKYQNVETYMLLIQSKCEVLANEVVIGNKTEDEYYGVKQNTGKYTGDKGWYKLTQADLNDMGVKDAKAADGYFINYQTNDVAYEKGIENNGQVFYELSEMLKYSGD